MENNELQHWGIKGQRWGHRRYQNKDGSLTPAGRKRYDDDGDNEPAYKKQYEAARKEIAAERAAQRNAKAVGKYEAKMAKLEYKQAKQEAKAQEKAEKRKAFAKKVAIGAGIAAAAGLTYYGIKKYRDKQAIGEDLAKKMLDNMKDYTVDDVGAKAIKGRSKFGDIFSKVKTKLEDGVETGPMKDDGDRFSASGKSKAKSSKPDYDIEIQDAPKKSAPKTEKKRPADILDAEFKDITPDSSNRGKSAIAGYLNSPVSGLLSAPKSDSTPPKPSGSSKKKITKSFNDILVDGRKRDIERTEKEAKRYRDDVTELWKRYETANARQKKDIKKQIDHANRMADMYDTWAEIYKSGKI